ncbi:glycosyltransferase family 2 protein [Spirosoma linguale]|uniref:Glycosyl transferase family 2 n=1 Tax=Spirosoma linguale (strain ATCC 33905 / DSM 74 / LMG 10896 / Claus 1) TaxID=504472 RepID=D2QH18_SPILD|nr:glycosyl transferase family 2 [Spirosoma linguale DSM 74]
MIYIVIPVHNRRHYTIGCLACLSRQTITAQQVIVVDDGSTDGTTEQIRSSFSDVVVLPGDGSLWWAGATNLGIRYVLQTFNPGDDDFILTLNDDTTIDTTYLESLLSAYQAHKPCIVGSVSVDVKAPQRLLYAGTRLNLLIPDIENWAETRFKNRYDRLKTTAPYLLSDSLPGRGMFIPRAVFDRIGFFDEQRFRHHMADLDFSVRARRAGFPLVVSASSVVHEFTDATGVNLQSPMSLRAFIEALSAIKSPINYRTRYHFAVKHARLPYAYFTVDMLRILLGYLRRQLNVISRQSQ